jgi:hypothetical protein
MVEAGSLAPGRRGIVATDTLWVMTADTTLVAGDSLTLLWNPEGTDDDAPARLGRAVILERLSAPPNEPGAFMDPEGGDVFYLARDIADSTEYALGFALGVPIGAFRRRDKGWLEADLDGDGTLERFHVCASYEGVHLNVWSGVPYDGVLRWTRYYYVPYDTEPTCRGLAGADSKDR